MGLGGGIGRRNGLKIRWAKARVGSSPTPGIDECNSVALSASVFGAQAFAVF